MLEWIIGLALIIGAAAFAVLTVFAHGMSAVPRETPRSVFVGCGLAALLGIAIIVWG